mmetsp:Transcript_25146/g.59844  ORF Transcript_25146/g.59844 Transcript_25146/m.59844 type:complete len:246 (+) Transcript_25146:482-1219(+)
MRRSGVTGTSSILARFGEAKASTSFFKAARSSLDRSSLVRSTSGARSAGASTFTSSLSKSTASFSRRRRGGTKGVSFRSPNFSRRLRLGLSARGAAGPPRPLRPLRPRGVPRRNSRALSSALARSSCSRISSRCRSLSCSTSVELCCFSSDCAFCASASSRLAWSSCCCSCLASCWLLCCAALARSSCSCRRRWAPKSTARTRLAKAKECAVSVASRRKGLTCTSSSTRDTVNASSNSIVSREFR